MDPLVAKMCGRYCKNSFVITRNNESRNILRELGVPTELGTDTAWTFEPLGAEYGQKALRDVGWDGKTPVLAVCPINPFEWPVKASLTKAALHSLTGAYKESHYRGPYFHNAGPEADRAYEHYLSSIANGVAAFRQKKNVFCNHGGDRAPGCAALPAYLGKAGWSTGADLGGLQHVRNGQHSAGLPHDGVFAVSRDCDFDAGAGSVGGDHHG